MISKKKNEYNDDRPIINPPNTVIVPIDSKVLLYLDDKTIVTRKIGFGK